MSKFRKLKNNIVICYIDIFAINRNNIDLWVNFPISMMQILGVKVRNRIRRS